MNRMDILRSRAKERAETINDKVHRIFYAEKLGMHERDLPDDINSETFCRWFNDRYGKEILEWVTIGDESGPILSAVGRKELWSDEC